MAKREYTHTVGVAALLEVCPSLRDRLTNAQIAQLAAAIGTGVHRIMPNIGEKAMAFFIGQCAHESGEFKWPREIWGPNPAQKRYWTRRDLQGEGPLYPGLGKLARGIGWIQTTGRSNLRRAAKVLGRKSWTLLAAQGSDPYIATLLAAIWWDDAFHEEHMDGWSVERVSRRVNLGNADSHVIPNGMPAREMYTRRAMRVRKKLVPKPL